MLKSFIDDAAHAFETTGHPLVQKVAGLMSKLEVDENCKILRKVPTPSSLQTALCVPECHLAANKLSLIADDLVWNSAALSRPLPNTFVGSYSFVAIVGPDGMIQNDQFRFGVYLQEPDTFYPSHKHEAEEFYLPLSGAALWQKDANDFEPIKAGQLIHHLPYQPHATWTHDFPLLALWAWTGNLSLNTYSFV